MNAYPFKIEVTGGRLPFTREFKSQLNAEIYRYSLGQEYGGTPNFELKYSEDELITEVRRHKKLLIEATRLQEQAIQRTNNNFHNPAYNPCEVCGEKHENYKCCEQCNIDRHTCHFCGDSLGHREVSACYILEGLGE